MPNKVYDILKYITMIFLPAMATLYASLAKIWNFPCAEEVVASIAAITTFMGIVLMINNINYHAKQDEPSAE